MHLFFIPLDVLVTWRSPARLSITTQPTGATLKLDGVPLAGTAPMTVSVWRDRAPHVVEASIPGFETTRDNVRYDKSVTLSVQMYLPKDKPATPPPPPPPPAGDAPAPDPATGQRSAVTAARPAHGCRRQTPRVAQPSGARR